MKHLRIHIIVIICLLAVTNNLQAQPDFQQIDYLQVFHGSQSLKYPWGGGLNSPQLTDPDLNNDGRRDLVVYEKTEDRLLSFIATSSGEYRIDRSFAATFPSIQGWLVLKDINCDGVDDLFTYGNASIRVYSGYYENDTLKFSLFSDGIFYPGFSGRINLYSTFVDRPAIADFDNDGDLDILTFNVTFTRMNYYRNMRIERSLSCDTLAYKLEDNCWGNVYESGLSAEVELRDTCPDKFPFPGRLNPYYEENLRRHAGSTLEAFDISGNGRLDILMGDVSFNFVNYLRNTGTLEYASILAQDTAFPRYNTPARVFSFPWSFFTDIDQDGRKDLIVTPFEGFGVDNIENVWYYKNVGTDSVRLNFQTKSFIVGDMIDAGENAVPCLIDIDGDGLTDLLIGGGVRLSGNPPTYAISYYRNVGAPDYPVFSLVDTDFLSFTSTGFQEPYPAAGDLDGDGKKDVLVGLSDGRILFYKNQTTSGFSPSAPSLLKVGASDLDVGQNAAPFVIDIDRDNKNDLLVGERNGNINFFSNTGSSGNIQLVQQTDSVGKIKTSTPFIPFGNAAPVVLDINGDTKLDLVYGAYENSLQWVSNIEDSIFLPITSQPLLPNLSMPVGRKLSPAIADLTDDGKWELLIGLQAGGLNFFSENPPPFRPVSTFERASNNNLRFKIYPNPAQNLVVIQLNNVNENNEIIWEMMDVAGRVLQRGNASSSQWTIDVQSFSSGIYIIRLIDAQGVSGAQSLIKQ